MNAPYERIADDLRDAIERGDYPPGSRLPTVRELAEQYDVAPNTAATAIATLEREGLVSARPRAGTVVLPAPERQLLIRERMVWRDEIGYYFDRTAQPWRALDAPTVTWGRAPADVCAFLGVERGDEVLVRDRLLGDPQSRVPAQLATSYLPASVVRELPVLGQADTGRGGIYDRMEDSGLGPLKWSEIITAAVANPDEFTRLRLLPAAPLLRIVRTTAGSDGRVLEVNDTRMSARRFAIGHEIRRHSSARPASTT